MITQKIARALFLLLLVALLVKSGDCHAFDVKETYDVCYSETDGQNLLLDVYEPVNRAKKRPALLWVHSGAWNIGDKDEFYDIAVQLAGEGYVSFSINYRLARRNGNHWPAQLQDTQQAVRWIKANAKQYRVDPNKIGACGSSAGAHIVCCLGTMPTVGKDSDPKTARYSSKVACIVSMAGPTDLRSGAFASVALGKWVNQQVRILLGADPKQAPGLAASASPLLHVSKSSAPALLYYGKRDMVVPPVQVQKFGAALESAGVKCVFLPSNAGHDLDNPEDTRLFYEMLLIFLNEQLGSE